MELETSLASGLHDPSESLAMGARAGDLVRRNTGALDRTVDDLQALLGQTRA